MAGVLTDTSNALAANVEAASLSVVRVDARSRLAASGVVWASDLAVTAHHVVEQEDSIKIWYPMEGRHPLPWLTGIPPRILWCCGSKNGT